MDDILADVIEKNCELYVQENNNCLCEMLAWIVSRRVLSRNIPLIHFRCFHRSTSGVVKGGLHELVATAEETAWLLPSPPLSERRYRRHAVCVSDEPYKSTACRISLDGEGNSLYPVLSSLWFFFENTWHRTTLSGPSRSSHRDVMTRQLIPTDVEPVLLCKSIRCATGWSQLGGHTWRALVWHWLRL